LVDNIKDRDINPFIKIARREFLKGLIMSMMAIPVLPQLIPEMIREDSMLTTKTSALNRYKKPSLRFEGEVLAVKNRDCGTYRTGKSLIRTAYEFRGMKFEEYIGSFTIIDKIHFIPPSITYRARKTSKKEQPGYRVLILAYADDEEHLILPNISIDAKDLEEIGKKVLKKTKEEAEKRGKRRILRIIDLIERARL